MSVPFFYYLVAKMGIEPVFAEANINPAQVLNLI